jgi:hypothetical protein
MAAPATTAILAERLYALGVEAEELRAACVSTGDSGTAKILDRFCREFNIGRGQVQAKAELGSDFAARSEAEENAHLVAEFLGTTSTGFDDRINAIIAAAGLEADWECTAVV